MKINGMYRNHPMNFRATYKNPDGTEVNISKKAIEEIKTTAYIRKAVDEAYRKNPTEFYKHATNTSFDGPNTSFFITKDGKCYFYPNNDYIFIHLKDDVEYMGETKFGINKGRPWEVHAKNNETGQRYSDENGSIRAYGSSYKYAHIQPDYSVEVSYPEWAPKD